MEFSLLKAHLPSLQLQKSASYSTVQLLSLLNFSDVCYHAWHCTAVKCFYFPFTICLGSCIIQCGSVILQREKRVTWWACLFFILFWLLSLNLTVFDKFLLFSVIPSRLVNCIKLFLLNSVLLTMTVTWFLLKDSGFLEELQKLFSSCIYLKRAEMLCL